MTETVDRCSIRGCLDDHPRETPCRRLRIASTSNLDDLRSVRQRLRYACLLASDRMTASSATNAQMMRATMYPVKTGANRSRSTKAMMTTNAATKRAIPTSIQSNDFLTDMLTPCLGATHVNDLSAILSQFTSMVDPSTIPEVA